MGADGLAVAGFFGTGLALVAAVSEPALTIEM